MSACNKQPPPDHPMHGTGIACHMHEGHEGGCTWALEPSPARRGIDRLLAVMRNREIELVDSQPERPVMAIDTQLLVEVMWRAYAKAHFKLDDAKPTELEAEGMLAAFKAAEPAWHELARNAAGPWVLVRFVGGGEFAIWKATGDVYQVGLDGAVGEDPIIRGDG